jgi:ribose transport system permease protein
MMPVETAIARPPAVDDPEPDPRVPASRPDLLRFAEAYAMVGLTVAVALFFTFYGPTSSTFFTTANLQVLVGNQSVIAIVTLAALVPLVCEEFDLSVGVVAGLSAVFVADTLSKGTPIPVAVVIGIALGGAVGVVNALLITRARVNAVVTTLGMSTIVGGILTWKTGGTAIVANIPQSLTDFGSGNTFGIPRTTYVLAAVAAAVYYMLVHTPLGRYLYALGSNPQAARLVGLRGNLLLGSTFVLSGLLAGSAGALQVARSGGADPRVGDNFTLPALAAAFLSAASIRPGRYNVGGALVAIFFLAVINNGLNLAGAADYIGSFVNGAALIIGVGLAAHLGHRRAGA